MADQRWWVRPDWTGSPEESPSSPGRGWHGPYPNSAAAFQAQLDNGPASTPQRIGTVPGAPTYAPPNFSWVGAIGHWIGDFVLHITDAHMWISIGWLVLGILLMVYGIYLWFRTSDTYKSLESSAAGVAAAL